MPHLRCFVFFPALLLTCMWACAGYCAAQAAAGPVTLERVDPIGGSANAGRFAYVPAQYFLPTVVAD